MSENNSTKMWRVPFTSIPFGANVALYGFGKIGKRYLRTLCETKRVKVVVILDAYVDGDEVDGIPICKPIDVSLFPVDYIIISVESGNIASEMKLTLLQEGIDEDKIIWIDGNDDERFVKESTKFSLRFLQSYRGRFFLFMLPEHGNTGDYAIGYAAEKFLRDYFPEHQVLGVTSLEWIASKEFFLNIIRPDDVIFFNGGGYWGDLRGDDLVYRDIVEAFPNQKKIFLPNTLTYKKESFKNGKFSNDMNWLASQLNTTVIFRDKRSYDIVREYDERVYCYPDMAFYLKFPRNGKSNGKILLCFRDDMEKIFMHNDVLKSNLLNAGISYEEFDIYTKKYVSQEDGHELLDSVVKLFQSFDCVLTDRLHGMILSVISDVPCLAFDSYTKKISGVYKWIPNKRVARILSEENVSKISDEIYSIVAARDKEGGYVPDYGRFADMAQVIKKIL
jgi:pyruvyl transferase EpsI